ncbi:spore germination protein (amino acid permease) [Seinonella peptonophila]|uniref:Spore germination protein (Amino acid permease) n=1 Tax=Seinonella peptonophila TaxID=112248 RepID=A0A1M4Y445_9BACL|nr:GerAB/ArcD/ProY family transporter [Seinonella peptonophila]SHF00564.1 spore germination protein (amino acid permease) [Seinonella peptonophila]
MEIQVKNEKEGQLFTSGQLSRLFILYTAASSIAFMIQPLYLKSDFSGWWGIVLAYPISLFFIYFAVRLAQTHPTKKWIDFGKKIVGSWLHAIGIALFIAMFLTISILNLNNYTDFVGYIYLVNTPDFVITGVILLCAAIAASSGLRSIVYLSDGIFILIFLVTTFFVPLMVRDIDLNAGIALFTHFEPLKIGYATLFISNWIADLIMVLFLAPRFDLKQKPMKPIYISAGVSLFIIFIYWIVGLMLVGPHLGAHLRYPLLELVRHILIGEFLENLDPLFVAIWSITLILKIALLIYICSSLIFQYFHIQMEKKRYIPAIVALVLLGVSSFLEKFTSEYYFAIESNWIEYFLFFVKFVPIVYFLIYKIRSRKKKTKAS